MLWKLIVGIFFTLVRIVLGKLLFYWIISGISYIVEYLNSTPYEPWQLKQLLTRLKDRKDFIDSLSDVTGSASKLTPEMVNQLMALKCVDEELGKQTQELRLRRRLQKELRDFLARITFKSEEEPVAQAA